MSVNEEKRVAQDPDVKSKKGTQPKKYYKTSYFCNNWHYWHF